MLTATAVWLVPTLAVAAILIGFDQYPRRGRGWRGAVIVCTGIIALSFGLRGAQHVSRMARDLPEWDFLAFWVPARVAAQGGNFYDPAATPNVQSPHKYSTAFRRQVLDVGFLYPPWTMLFLAPLGRLAARPAGLVWALVQVAALLASVVVLWKVFQPAPGWRGFLLTVALLLSLSPTMATLAYGQISFLMLLFLALFWGQGNNWRGGVYLALTALGKPLGAFFVLRSFVERSWRVVGGAAATLAVVVVATVWRFGWKLSFGYFTSHLAARVPREMYVESNRQGLLAAVLRSESWDTVRGMTNPIMHPTYLAAAALLVIVSAILVVLLRSSNRDLALAILVPCALLVYPATITHYGVILILPVLYLWGTRAVHGLAFTILLISAVYGLTRAASGYYSMLAYLLLWSGLVGAALYRLRRISLASPAP